MAFRVVDALEVVHVDEDERDLGSVREGLAQLRAEPLMEGAVIRDVRDRVPTRFREARLAPARVRDRRCGERRHG
jgi:hypothetical protein